MVWSTRKNSPNVGGSWGVIECTWQASLPGDIDAAAERIITKIQQVEVRLRSILCPINAIIGTTTLSERHHGWPPAALETCFGD